MSYGRRPPQNVSEALRDGGLPVGFTLDMLQFLSAKHTDLATRKATLSSHDKWRLRWAYSCHDVAITIMQQPGSVQRLRR